MYTEHRTSPVHPSHELTQDMANPGLFCIACKERLPSHSATPDDHPLFEPCAETAEGREYFAKKREAAEVESFQEDVMRVLTQLTEGCHQASMARGWWHTESGVELLSDPEFAPYVVGTKLALAHSEISEAMEGYRKDQMDEKLPDRPAIEVELADVLIRVFDLAGRLRLDVAGAVVEKMGYNAVRSDHDLEVRFREGGKKF